MNDDVIRTDSTAGKTIWQRFRLSRRIPDETGLLVILIGFSVILTILSPYFLTVDNFVNVILTMSVTGITAIGMTHVMLSGELICLSGRPWLFRQL
jgi:ribose/xylose/arabinose/galactoside ABC-type transport system permease subunit